MPTGTMAKPNPSNRIAKQTTTVATKLIHLVEVTEVKIHNKVVVLVRIKNRRTPLEKPKTPLAPKIIIKLKMRLSKGAGLRVILKPEDFVRSNKIFRTCFKGSL